MTWDNICENMSINEREDGTFYFGWQGEDEGEDKILHELCGDMIKELVEEFGRPDIPEDNLIDELKFALNQAVKKFRPEMGADFEIYAEAFMRHHIRNYVEGYMSDCEAESEEDDNDEDECECKFIEDEKTLTSGIFAFFAGTSPEDEFEDFISEELAHMSNARNYSSEGIECAKNFLLLMYYGYEYDKAQTREKKDRRGSVTEEAEDFLENTLRNLTEKFRAEGLEDFASFKKKKRLWPFMRKSLMTSYMGEAAQIIGEYAQSCLDDLKEISTSEFLMYDAVSEEIICFASKPVTKLLRLHIESVLKSEGLEKQKIKDFLRRYTSPKAIVDLLDKEISGQYDAKWAVAIAFYKHLVRARSGGKQRPSERSVLLCGPSGSGKTALFDVLKKKSPVNIKTLACTELSPNGYKGGDLGPALSAVIKGKYDLIFFDEVDKLCKTGQDADYWHAVQEMLLKSLDGDPVLNDNNKLVDTQDLLFCFAGAFNGFEKAAERRVVGFGHQAGNLSERENAHKFDYRERLKELGMNNELAGRMNRIERTNKYDIDDYICIARINLKNWCSDQFVTYGRHVMFSDEAIRAAAELEVSKGGSFGARGLINRMTTIADDKTYRGEMQDEVLITAEDIA